MNAEVGGEVGNIWNIRPPNVTQAWQRERSEEGRGGDEREGERDRGTEAEQVESSKKRGIEGLVSE